MGLGLANVCLRPGAAAACSGESLEARGAERIVEEVELGELRERRGPSLARARERSDAGLADLVVVEAELAQPRQRTCGQVGRQLQRTCKGGETGVADLVAAEPQREQSV